MKILPKHQAFLPIVYLVPALGVILILFLPRMVTFCMRVHVVFLLLALLLILLPKANRVLTLAEKQAKPSFIKALSLTWLLQIGLILAFYAICHVTAAALPINVAPFPLFQSTLSIFLLNWGAFPWGLYVLMAVGLGYMGYVKKQPGDMSTLIRPLIRNQPADLIGITADVTTKAAIIISLGTTLALIAMDCMGLIGAFFNLSLGYGMRLDVLLITLLVVQSAKSDFFEKKLPQLVAPFPTLAIAAFLLVMIAVFLVLSLLIPWLSPTYTPILNRILDFVPTDWPVIWLIFAAVWWLSWAPLAGGMLAYIWRGYRIRTLVLMTLLLPITAMILEAAYPNWSLPISITNHWLNIVPALLGAGILISLFLRTRFITYAWKATLPTWRSYQRSPKAFLQRLLQVIVIFMGFYWVSGIYVAGMLYFIMTLPVALLVATVGVAVFRMR